MKILKIVLVVIGTLLGGFLLLGVFCTECTYETEAHFDKSPQEVWDVLNDQSQLGQWLDGFESIELTGGTDKSVGAQYKIIFKQEDETIEIIENVTEYTPPSTLAYSITNDVLTGNKKFALTQDGNGTKLVASVVFSGTNIIWRSILCLSRGSISDNEKTQLQKLSILIDGE